MKNKKCPDCGSSVKLLEEMMFLEFYKCENPNCVEKFVVIRKEDK